MREKYRRMMTLDLALSIIELYWSQKTKENILVFVGIDEYQKLDQEKLNSLLGVYVIVHVVLQTRSFHFSACWRELT